MTSDSSVCSLCFDNVEEKNLQVLNQSIQDMLGALLMYIDISASENAVICRTCQRKLENHYCFKKKCIFTEDTLSPFVAENVKMNLNEIRNQIIKSEVETEKNVCRLCLQYSDDDMTLDEDEKQQFAGLFPEINLNLTTFVVLCLTCYNTLHKYFIFVTSFHSKKFFGNMSRDNYKSSMNDEESAEKNVSIITGEMKMKSEGESSDFLEEKLDVGLVQIVNIKSEKTKLSLMDVEENDDIKPLLLQEELNIKTDEDSSEEPCLYSKRSRTEMESRRLLIKDLEESSYGSLPKENCTNRQKDSISNMHINSSRSDKSDYVSKRESHILSFHTNPDETKFARYLKKHVLDEHSDCSKVHMYKCVSETKREHNLQQHALRHHTSLSKIKMRKWDTCVYGSKLQKSLKKDLYNSHSDPSKINMYKCDKCDYATKLKSNLKRHIISFHTDPSEITIYKCDSCNYQTKLTNNLKRHILSKHSKHSEIQMYKCDKCDYESKYKNALNYHLLARHTSPSETTIYKCDKCDYECKFLERIKKHVLINHTDPSKIKMYKCDKCVYESKLQGNLKKHFLNNHSDHFKMNMYKCDKCDYSTKHKSNLKRHILSFHTDSSETTIYKCDSCNYQTKLPNNLRRHILSKHAEYSEVQMYKCEKCAYNTKQKMNLKRHVLAHHTSPSETTQYKLDKCDYESKWMTNFEKHVLINHTDSSETTAYIQ